MSEESNENISKLKQIVKNEGLYEAGMSDHDMVQICKTLRRSKRTATDDKEYHKILSQTELNCKNIVSLKIKADTTEAEKSNTSGKEINEIDYEEKIKASSSESDVVFNFTATRSCTPIVPIKRSKNVIPILYHNPTVLNLPMKRKAEVIDLYLQYENRKIKTRFVDQWNKPIIPQTRTEFIETISVKQETETSENEYSPEKDESSIVLRSNRIVKRRNYKEDESDEEFKPAENKKSKTNPVSSDKKPESQKFEPVKVNEDSHTAENYEELSSPILNKRTKLNDVSNITIFKKSNSQKSNESPTKTAKWYSKANLQKNAKDLRPEVSKRTNKLFDKLKEQENKQKSKVLSQKSELVSDLSDEDIFPTTSTSTITDIHAEVSPKPKRGKGGIVKKPLATKNRKKLNVKSTKENNKTEIPTIDFYGKDKDNELDVSNNNKTTAEAKTTQCPICSQPFPASEIEYHASRCEQYDNSEEDSQCDICHQYVLKSEIEAHKSRCLEKITQDSVQISNGTQKSNESFLCSICDQYVISKSFFEHASNCIGRVKDG